MTTNSSAFSSNTSTFIIKGRKRALREAYDRSLNVKHSYYCITGDELVNSYKQFLRREIRSTAAMIAHI
ncbi:MAG: hypothetical protein M3P08_02050 [Thermoproteota archaeon]|nr:hypothetical protein [Thermoproteota archaeon]